MKSQHIPISIKTIARKWYSYGFPRGGFFVWMLDASTVADATMAIYLPPVAADTMHLFVCVDATKDVTISASITKPLDGSTVAVVELAQYQAFMIGSTPDGLGWRQIRRGDKTI